MCRSTDELPNLPHINAITPAIASNEAVAANLSSQSAAI
jgi:hypothetical protein